MKKIAILGSTGSIGQGSLDVIRRFPDKFKVVGLSANSNSGVLLRQIKEFQPKFVCINDPDAIRKLKPSIKSHIELFIGEEGIKDLIRRKEIDKILLAISGSAALVPLLEAIENDKEIALANKEALVMAGPIIMERVRKKKIKIIPIDSEQSAIWQCLDGRDQLKLKNIYLTASGGPFRKTNTTQLKKISVDKAIKHPRWKMGKKISVDSATLMNKGLELLEAMFLFDVPCDKIKILIHPEAIVHSMVEFVDGVILAQLSATDMRIPIQYALTYPERLPNSFASIDFYKLHKLHFQKPNFKHFPCLRLAYRAANKLGTMPAVLNAANEVCVDKFLSGRLSFIYIPKVIEKVLDQHRINTRPKLGDILEADMWARNLARRVIENLN
jgi:1-deoxy-D-xylulose-5-phosphate reductoisomerase